MSAHGVFLAKDGASLFYLTNEGLGGHGLPPDHPNRTRSIREVRGGSEVGLYALSNVAEGGESWLPAAVIAACQQVLTDAGYSPEDV